MGDSSAFDGLVSKLSSDERLELLNKIKEESRLSSEPLFLPEALPDETVPDYEARAEALGFFSRLLLFFRRLFSGKSVADILADADLKEIGRHLEVKRPGLVDAKRMVIHQSFVEDLASLRDAARFFYDILERSIDRDKGAFIAFLGSIEMPEVSERLMRETDAAIVTATKSDIPDNELRPMLLGAFDEILLSLPEAGRKAMYQDLRSLLFLRRLSAFLFERLLHTFKPIYGGTELVSSFIEARDLLLELGDVIFSFSSPPSTELIESLFVFAARDALASDGFDAVSALAPDMRKAEEALSRIRSFNARIPLVDLLRLATENPAYAPHTLPGGEDWLSIYRAFWKERIEAKYEIYRSEKRYREISVEISTFIGHLDIGERKSLVNISREGNESAPPVRFELALAFLDGFAHGPFVSEFGRPLKILLMDGDFYRKENRIEYTDAYNALSRLPDILSTFDARLSTEGDLGSAWSHARLELCSLPVKKRRMQMIERGVDEEAERIVRDAAGALWRLVSILHGVLKGEAGGRYDSLSNLSSLDGRANKEYLRILERTKERCDRALTLLSEISGLDFSGQDQ